MDLILPEMDGYQATSKIREYEEENNVPRTYVCGNSAYISKGMQNKLPKGFD